MYLIIKYIKVVSTRLFNHLLYIVTNTLACGWYHNSRKLISVLLMIQNEFDYSLDFMA